MANPAGIVNGTKSLFKINTGAGQVVVGGEVSHSRAFGREAIDTTNKSSDQYRTVLDGDEGLKTLDITLDALYSDDAAYQFLRGLYFSGANTAAEYVVGSLTGTCTVKVVGMSDTANGNETVSTSFTIQSTGSFSEA